AFSKGRGSGMGADRRAGGGGYVGPWKGDGFAGPPTQMMRARAQFEKEARAAVAKEGQKVCRETQVGIGGRDWIRGVVVATGEDQVAVRIDDPGRQPHVVANVEVHSGEVVWDVPQAWMPCF